MQTGTGARPQLSVRAFMSPFEGIAAINQCMVNGRAEGEGRLLRPPLSRLEIAAPLIQCKGGPEVSNSVWPFCSVTRSRLLRVALMQIIALMYRALKQRIVDLCREKMQLRMCCLLTCAPVFFGGRTLELSESIELCGVSWLSRASGLGALLLAVNCEERH